MAVGNSTLELNDEEHIGKKWMCLIMEAEGAIGVLGNLLVCFVILRVKFLHNMTNYLLVNLAVADMLLCLQSIIFHVTASTSCAIITNLPDSFAARQLFCRLVASEWLSWALFNASAYNLCMVTFEKYVAIVHPLHYARKLTATRMKTLTALIWVMSFVFSMPFLFTNQLTDGPEQVCSRIKYQNLVFPVLITVYLYFTGYLIPITLMSFAYYKMQVTLKTQAKALKQQHMREAAYDLLIARQRLVAMLMIVLGVLIVLWSPSYTVLLLCLHPSDNGLLPFCHSKSFTYLHGFLDFAFYLNSFINPIIYQLKYKKFRKGLKVALCICYKRQGDNRVDIQMVPI